MQKEGTDTQSFGHMTTFFECFVCSLRHGAQVRKHVCRQSLQFVAVKIEPPVGQEADTRSDSHPFSHKRMRARSKRRRGRGF
jgi:hypothetical protein